MSDWPTFPNYNAHFVTPYLAVGACPEPQDVPEIAAAGHDRCPVAIKAEHIDAWLNPDPRNLEAVDVILDARPSVYFVNRPAN